jgi:hypothetical protein
MAALRSGKRRERVAPGAASMKPQRRVTRQAAPGLMLVLAATVALTIVLAQTARPAVSPPGAPVTPASATAPAPTVPHATDTATGIAAPTPSATRVSPTGTAPPTPDVNKTQHFLETQVQQTTQSALATLRHAAGATADFIETSLAATPSEPVPMGILDGAGVRADAHYLTGDLATFENMWRGGSTDGSFQAGVWAGALREDPRQGLVVVIVEGPVFTYLTPRKAGSLHVVAEHSLRLTLLSANGSTFYFDVPGRRFVASLSQAVPTATPFAWPTGSPTPVPPTAAPVPTCTPGPTPAHASGEVDCLAD